MRLHLPLALGVWILASCDSPGSEWEVSHPGCESCEIVLTEFWRSGPENEYVDLSANLVRTSDGGFLHETSSGDQIVLHDPDGSSATIVGRNGDGPGEYRAISVIRPLEDGGIAVIDRTRLTLLGDEFELRSVHTLPLIVEDRAAVLFSDSTLVVGSARGAGEPQQRLVSFDGEVLSEFDTEHGERSHTFLGPGLAGTVWSAPQMRIPQFVIEHWDPVTGQRVNQFVRSPPWFTAWTPPVRSEIEVPVARSVTPPAVIDLFQSADGLLWVITRVAQPEPQPDDGYDGRFDTILEAIDPETGAVVGARYLKEFLAGFTSSGHIYRLDETRAHPVIRVLSFALDTN